MKPFKQLALALAACGAPSAAPTVAPSEPTAAAQPAGEQKIVVYSGRSESLVAPLFGLGQLTTGRHLITSRRATGWHHLARAIDINVLPAEDATDLLVRISGRTAAEERMAAADLATELGYLPLALEQAGAYIHRQGLDFAAYRQRLRRYPARMYATSADGGQHERTIARIWHLTLDTIVVDMNARKVWCTYRLALSEELELMEVQLRYIAADDREHQRRLAARMNPDPATREFVPLPPSDQSATTSPVALESAPYLAALVHNSCTMRAKVCTPEGPSATCGPEIRTRSEKPAISALTTSRRSAPCQLASVSSSCAWPSDCRRPIRTSCASSRERPPVRVREVMDWNTDSRFLTRCVSS